MAGILDFQLPDYSKVGQGVQRADIPEIPSIPEQGYLGQAVADDIQARKNFRNQQVPSPLMMEDPNAALLPEAPTQPLDIDAAPVVTPQPQAAVTQPQAQADRGIAYAPTQEAHIEDNEVKQAYTEGKKQAAMAIGEQDEIAARQKNIQDLQAQKDKAFEESRLKGQEVDAELSKLEPKDYWADKSTGTKIAAAIAMGMGAYASAMTGTQNGAMQIINDAISRDLNLQKEKYQRAKERGASIKSVYADTVARLGDREAAELTLANMAYKKIDMKLAAQQAATQNQERQMNIQKMRQEIAQNQQAMEAKRAERMMLAQLSKPGAGSKGINAELLSEENKKRFVTDPEFGGLAKSESAANKVSEQLVDYRNAKDLLNVLFEIQRTPGKSVSPELRSRAQTAAAALKGKLKGPVVGAGAVSESEWAILNSIVQNPTDFFVLDNVAKERLRSIDSMVTSNMKNVASVYMTNAQTPVTSGDTATVKIDGKPYTIPYQNLEPLRKAMEFKKKKFEVISGQ